MARVSVVDNTRYQIVVMFYNMGSYSRIATAWSEIIYDISFNQYKVLKHWIDKAPQQLLANIVIITRRFFSIWNSENILN